MITLNFLLVVSTVVSTLDCQVINNYRRKNVGIHPQAQSQMFNVGYSMSFNGEQNKPKPKAVARYQPTGDIITGKRKRNEEVAGPNVNLSPQEFVTQALMKSKMYNNVNNNSKRNVNQQSTSESSLIKHQVTFSPKTQRFIKAYEKTRALQNNAQKYKNSNKKVHNEYSWRTLSPGVEIVKSSEIPINHKLTNEPIILNNNNKHYKSIKKSSEVENNIQNNDSLEPITQKYDDRISNEKFDPIKDFNYNFNHDGALKNSETFDLSNGLENNIQTPKKYKIDIDTSLIRDPVITTDPQEMANNLNNPKIIPIHFDIRPIEQAMNNPDMFEKHYPNPYILPISNNEYNNYNNNQQMHEDYSYQDYQMAAQNQFKIYGKPQPVKKYNNAEIKHRQPRRDFESISHMRPPPVAHKSYQRRAFIHH